MIEPNKIADLILIDGDTLADIANTRRVAAVIYRGRLFEQSEFNRIRVPPKSAVGDQTP